MKHPAERTQEERAYYELSARVYAVFAPVYDLVVAPFRRLRDEVAGALALGPSTRVLDVATGTGAQARSFAPRAGEVIGIDMSDAMLQVARRKTRLPNVRFLHADAAKLPFDDHSFDVTSVSFALHEMPLSLRQRVVREMVRVTKAGGTVAIVDYGLPRSPPWRWLVYHVVKLYEIDHYADFARSDVRALLSDAGIRMETEQPLLRGAARLWAGHPRAAGEVVTPSSIVDRVAATEANDPAPAVAGPSARTSHLSEGAIHRRDSISVGPRQYRASSR